MSKKLLKEAEIKPFLKWAGGKTQLLPAIEAKLMPLLQARGTLDYIEPFVGSGAVLFFLLKNYSQHLNRIVINDINPVLTDCYATIKEAPEQLIKQLSELEEEYFRIPDEADRKELFLEKRHAFNQTHDDRIRKSALLIFLNKTCFNGLYRVNAKGGFNVPFGRYTNPTICNAPVIRVTSAALQKVNILNTDFIETGNYANQNAFYYLDPPYKPISATASFNAYAKEGFVDEDQLRLKSFCDALHAKGAYFVQSNSDTSDPSQPNGFFQELYSRYTIEKVKAKRAINSKGSGRGEINELLISNDQVLLAEADTPLAQQTSLF